MTAPDDLNSGTAVYHTLFWLDYYLADDDNYTPPAPFTLGELDPSGVLPDRVYTKDEMLGYLEHGRRKCQLLIRSLTEQSAHQRCKSNLNNLSVVELLLYNMRHVQHHTAQLNLVLRETIDNAPRWVRRARIGLEEDI